MKKVLLFGASGHVGRAIAQELHHQQFHLTVAVRSELAAQKLRSVSNKSIIFNLSKPETLRDICQNFDVVVSALGKSVSINDTSRTTFQEIDLQGNLQILEEAKKSGVKKFVYISAFHAERYLRLEYFRAHHEFSEHLMQSGLDYAIIKPPAVFSAFLDIVPLAGKGRNAVLGKGDKKTNPIYEHDLAKVVVSAIELPKAVIEAGGKKIYTRSQINEIIQSLVDPRKKIWRVPITIVKIFLPLLKIIHRSQYEKFAFFLAVIQDDVLAPGVGETRFEDYMLQKVKTKH